MIPIGPFPILWHIMRYYAHFGHNEFIVCTGYKSQVIKEFFLNLQMHSHDFTVDYAQDHAEQVQFHTEGKGFQPKVTVAYTGQETMTGARIKRVESYLGDDEEFMLTYGDGVSDVDLDALLSFHRSHGKLATLTAVYPPAKFGGLSFEGDQVTSFAEKEGQQGAMVNGGFYILHRRVLDFVSGNSSCVFEQEPLNALSSEGQLMAFRHTSYWQCMDTTRDLDALQTMWSTGQAPWRKWDTGYLD